MLLPAPPCHATCSSRGAATARESPAGRLSILVPIQSLQGEVWLSPAGLCVAVGSARVSRSGCSEGSGWCLWSSDGAGCTLAQWRAACQGSWGEVRGCGGNRSVMAPVLHAAGRLEQEAQGIPGSRDPVRVLGSWCSPLGQEELVTQYTRTLVCPCSVVVPF